VQKRTHFIALLLVLLLSACAPNWTVELAGPDSTLTVDHTRLQELESFAEDDAVPLERVLWESGYSVIETVTVTRTDGDSETFAWPNVAEDALWQFDGEVVVGETTFTPERIAVTPHLDATQITAQITDLAPTAAAALGLLAPAKATGDVLTDVRADHVLLLFLDGFGYVRYTEALADGLIPNLATLPAPQRALTVYPPCTSVASAAILTGAEPAANGVDRRGIRTTEAETLLDVAAGAGLNVKAVEGNALAFNMRNAEIELSGDKDGDGSTDDNVLTNALAVLETGMPDLFWVHFHGIDDAGHTYGPSTSEEAATIREVDVAVGEILAALPGNTLVLIFADHGMHPVNEEGRLGNHGNLIARDMVIPIWTVVTE
jgi:hypothetical protein